MTDTPLSPMDEHTALVARLQGEADALREELDETNQGVLALYAELDTQAEQLRQASDLKSRFLSYMSCLLYTSPSPRDATLSRMPSSA